jgi:hypothetical protein
MEWRSIHVYYHDDQDRLVVDAVRPLFGAIAGEVDAAYFTRHWRRGPHVRLNVRADNDVYENTVRPAVDEIVGGYLKARPSTVDIDERELAPLHETLARLERDTGPLSPWLPDNSIHDAGYDQRQHVLGPVTNADLIADFYVATNDIAFAMAEHVLLTGQRLAPCLDLMVATAQAYSGGGLTRGFVSFRSHAEAFLSGTPGAQRYRAVWQDRYAERADQLRERIDEVLATLDGTGDVPLVRDWVSAVRPIHRRSTQLISVGTLLSDEPAPPPGTNGVSPFHDVLLSGPTYSTEIRNSLWFRGYRVMLNCLYLQFTRHGVRPVDRMLLCHLVANAVEERIGTTALDLVAGRAIR